MIEHKIVFAGPTGAGKTTAIGAVSEVDPVCTEVHSHDADVTKEFTTVALDYGELTLEDENRLRLYGTPGQRRFGFMWPILARGALGLVILVDSSQPEAVAELEAYVDGFGDLIRRTGCVVGVGRLAAADDPALDRYAARLAELGVVCPVVPVDVRRQEDVRMLLDLLLLQLEIESGEAAAGESIGLGSAASGEG